VHALDEHGVEQHQHDVEAGPHDQGRSREIKGDQGRSMLTSTMLKPARTIKGDQGRSMLTSTMLKPARTRKKRIIKKVDAMTCGDKAPW